MFSIELGTRDCSQPMWKSKGRGRIPSQTQFSFYNIHRVDLVAPTADVILIPVSVRGVS